jgi:hypothetical protein
MQRLIAAVRCVPLPISLKIVSIVLFCNTPAGHVRAVFSCPFSASLSSGFGMDLPSPSPNWRGDKTLKIWKKDWDTQMVAIAFCVNFSKSTTLNIFCYAFWRIEGFWHVKLQRHFVGFQFVHFVNVFPSLATCEMLVVSRIFGLESEDSSLLTIFKGERKNSSL